MSKGTRKYGGVKAPGSMVEKGNWEIWLRRGTRMYG